MKEKKSIAPYEKRRNFAQTQEPPFKKETSSKKKALFVVQKHDASHLHYDFRLEIKGVLVSWAIPKGPSMNPSIKRLAIRTEDHPFAYKDFEGKIPEGNYGAGSVEIWDKGTVCSIKKRKNGTIMPLSSCLKAGTIEIFLEGKKLHGAFALIKTLNKWLLIKMNDGYAKREKKQSTVSTSIKKHTKKRL